MVYSLNDNVYFVKGTVNGCIYDFNNTKLYHMNNMLATKIESLNEGTLSSKIIDAELKQIIDKFLNIGIIKLSDHVEKHYIEEISKNHINMTLHGLNLQTNVILNVVIAIMNHQVDVITLCLCLTTK